MRRLLTVTENASALFLLLIALLTAGNVVLRDLFSVQIPDWFDGSRQLQGVALFWGIALATWRGSHICVDIVWEHLSAGRRRAMDVAATTITLAFLAPMSWMVWKKVAGSGGQVTADLGLPLQWFYAVGAVGATVAALLAGLRIIALLRGRSHEDIVDRELAELTARNAPQATAGGADRSAPGRPANGS